MNLSLSLSLYIYIMYHFIHTDMYMYMYMYMHMDAQRGSPSFGSSPRQELLASILEPGQLRGDQALESATTERVQEPDMGLRYGIISSIK